MQLTDEQKLIVQSDVNILLVNAYAGTGKTSTLVEYCKLRANKKILYLAYNSSMSKEAKKKFQGLNVYCSTIHSLAYQSVGKLYDERLKNENSIRPFHLLKFFAEKDYKSANSLMSVFRDFLFSKNSIEEIIKKYQSKVSDSILKKLPILWENILNDSSFPFEHDFYLKIYQLQYPVLEYDYILVDEAQDLNPVMFDIVVRQNAKKVFIGDSFQKIYGFRECIDALKMLEGSAGSQTLYLTETFRCPTKITEIANPYLGLLRAKKPLISHKNDEDLPISNQECIICRTNAKVLEFVSENLESKIHFIGGVKSYKFGDLIDLLMLSSNNLEAKQRIKNPFYRNFDSLKDLISYLKDFKDSEIKGKVALLFKFLSNGVDIFELLKGIKDSKKEEADFIITSAHKSKGLEFDSVILENDFINISGELEKQSFEEGIDAEELNLLYVAITRAKKSLYLDDAYVLSQEVFSQAYRKLKFFNA